MRHNLKAAAVSALAIMAALAMSIPAYAADKKISEVKFRVNAKPEAGSITSTGIGKRRIDVTRDLDTLRLAAGESVCSTA